MATARRCRLIKEADNRLFSRNMVQLESKEEAATVALDKLIKEANDRLTNSKMVSKELKDALAMVAKLAQVVMEMLSVKESHNNLK